MAKPTVTTTTKPTTTTAASMPALPATTAQPVLASGASVATPAVAAQPNVPATLPAIGGYAAGTTNAVPPAPGSVFAAVLVAMQANGGSCTLAQAQAAIAACGRKGSHPLLPLLRWQARNRGWAFALVGGQGGQLHAYATLAAYQAAGY